MKCQVKHAPLILAASVGVSDALAAKASASVWLVMMAQACLLEELLLLPDVVEGT